MIGICIAWALSSEHTNLASYQGAILCVPDSTTGANPMLDKPENKGIYHPLKNDGADYKCSDCDTYKPYNHFWYVECPNGTRYVCCKDCIDPYWIKHHAIFSPEPI